MHINHLLNALNTRARGAVRKAITEIHFNSCHAITITSIEDFVEHVTKRYLSTLANCGRKSIAEVEHTLRDMGYLLKVK